MSGGIQACPNKLSDWVVLSSVEIPGREGQTYTLSGITPQLIRQLPPEMQNNICQLSNGGLFQKTSERIAVAEAFGDLMWGASPAVNIPDALWAKNGEDPSADIAELLKDPPPIHQGPHGDSDWRVITGAMTDRWVAQIRYIMDDRDNELFQRSQRPGSYYVRNNVHVVLALAEEIYNVSNSLEYNGHIKAAGTVKMMAQRFDLIHESILKAEDFTKWPARKLIIAGIATVGGLAGVGRIAFGYMQPGGSNLFFSDIRAIRRLVRHPVQTLRKIWERISKDPPDGSSGGGGSPVFLAQGADTTPVAVDLPEESFTDGNMLYSRHDFLTDVSAISCAGALAAFGIATSPLTATGGILKGGLVLVSAAL